MIQIRQLKLPLTHTKEDLEEKTAKLLRISRDQLLSLRIAKQSIDARKKHEICYVYTIEAETPADRQIAARLRRADICFAEPKPYHFSACGKEKPKVRPIIAGSGPAGLFCAYFLAQAGYAPLVLERGKAIEERRKDVMRFWQDGILDENSNVQFGEGGAGTFSDGKLNTLVKDPDGRGRKVLEIFAAHGAPEEICYEAKPHIGTDRLAGVITSIRREILAMGGEVRFESCLTDLRLSGGCLSAVEINRREWMDAQTLVLAIGHSARDTFEMLLSKGIPMEAKAFAVGLRIEHLQEEINRSQYREAASKLPPASYRLAVDNGAGRSVYSFCMCPGGYVINASSERGRLAINGMSNQARDSKNANSAIVVAVCPDDFGGSGPLSGIMFQRRLEEKAFQIGGGAIPQQLYDDFAKGQMSTAYRSISPMSCGSRQLAPLHQLFEKTIYESLLCGMKQFEQKIAAFGSGDAILSGVESRTSSPVKIPRGTDFQSAAGGIFPCGEGAGYAGGILSAAMDGMKAAEAIAARYAPD